MLAAVAVLLFAQLAGETLVRVLSLPIPGPVAGMVLLAAGLLLRQRSTLTPDICPAPLASVADTLLRNMSLMFIPVGCGIIDRLAVVGPNLHKILIILFVSTILALIATATTFVFVQRLMSRSR